MVFGSNKDKAPDSDPAADRELKALEAEADTESPEDRAGNASQSQEQAKHTLKRICDSADSFGAPWALTGEEKTLVTEGCSPLAADYMNTTGDLPKWAKWTLACLALTVVGVPRIYAAKAAIAPPARDDEAEPIVHDSEPAGEGGANGKDA